MILKAPTKGKMVGGHEFVEADRDDPFWVGLHGYTPVEEVGEEETGEGEEMGEGETTDEEEAVEEPTSEEEEIDLESMTAAQLEEFAEAEELNLDLSKHRLKAAKVAAVIKALNSKYEPEQ